MQSFRSFLAESIMIQKLEEDLRKLGYTKFKMSTRTTLLVYVPTSERATAQSHIAKSLKGEIDKSPAVMRKISSIGGIVFLQGPYTGLMVGIKPDKSSSLTTDEQESLAGIHIAAKLYNAKTKYTARDLKKFGDPHIKSRHKSTTLFEKAGKGWLNSSRVIAETFTPYLNKSKRYTVHQRSGSRLENSISNRAKELIKESGHKMGLDKWNPADIWIATAAIERTVWSNFDSILELNTFIKEKFESKDLIGVSLKQVGEKAKVETYNNDVKTPISFTAVEATGKTGFVGSLNITLTFTGGSMIIRNFGRPESVSGEINGALAQGGKVGSGPLFNILEQFDSKFSTLTHQAISQKYESNPTEVYDHLYEAFKKHDSENAKKYTLTDYVKEVESKTNKMNYIISRWQTSDIVDSINRMTKAKKTDFINAALGYASSSTEISSVFYKVS